MSLPETPENVGGFQSVNTGNPHVTDITKLADNLFAELSQPMSAMGLVKPNMVKAAQSAPPLDYIHQSRLNEIKNIISDLPESKEKIMPDNNQDIPKAVNEAEAATAATQDNDITIDPREAPYMIQVALKSNENLSARLMASQARVMFYEDSLKAAIAENNDLRAIIASHSAGAENVDAVEVTDTNPV